MLLMHQSLKRSLIYGNHSEGQRSLIIQLTHSGREILRMESVVLESHNKLFIKLSRVNETN